MKPTVSLCMIVKDEEAVIGKCLESVKAFVDEMIVVDTGSTDRTREIATSMGAKVVDFAWDNNFSSARNFAKEQATMEWIIQLDADEYFLASEAGKIKEEINNTDKLVLNIKILNLVGEGEKGTTHTYTRIYKNIPEIKYQNAIHEQVLFNGQVVQIGDTSIRIMHTGYTEETYRNKKKRERNMKLIKKELKENPENGFMLFNLANEFAAMNEYEKALRYYIKAHKAKQNSGVGFAVVRSIVKTLIQLKRNDEALKVIAEAKVMYPDYTDLVYFEGEIMEDEGRIEDAIRAYEACIRMGESNKEYMTFAGLGTIYPRQRLLVLYKQQRQFEKAIGYAAELLTINKFHPSYVVELVKLLRPTFTEDQIVTYLEEVYPENTKEELELKLQVCELFRMKKGISYYIQKMKSNAYELEIHKTDVYRNLFSGNEESAKENIMRSIEGRKKDALSLAFVYYYHTKDRVVKEKLMSDKTAKLMIEVMEGSYKTNGRKSNYKHDLYIGVLSELILCKDYELFERLLVLVNEFPVVVLKEIGTIFYENMNDDLAIEYYVRFMQFEKNKEPLYRKVAQLLYATGMYEEAILFAQKALLLNKRNGGAVEVLINCFRELGEKEMMGRLVEEVLTLSPNSPFAKEQKEHG